MGFRLLRADEIECRVAQIKANGLSLLLYKDARCDMNILDETVGSFNWKRSHTRENANCIVEIWDKEKGQWISKEDTGTESNTEREKGLASDSFKRACFNWGIGRELYTAPFIWIPSDKCKIVPNNNKFACYDRFQVAEIGYDANRRINRLVITSKSNIVYSYGSRTAQPDADHNNTDAKVTAAHVNTLRNVFERDGVDECKVLKKLGLEKLEDATIRQFNNIMQHPDSVKGTCSK